MMGPGVVFSPWRIPGRKAHPGPRLCPVEQGPPLEEQVAVSSLAWGLHPAGVCAPPLALWVHRKHLRCQGPRVRAHLADVRGLDPL